MPKKLVLCVVDSLRTASLEAAIASGDAPYFAQIIDRGAMVPDCVSSFPSVTPVACSEIITGTRPDRHWIPGMNWYHRGEQRYVEYGSSFEATRAFGLFRSLYDTVYNMNMAHLSHEVETVFERLADAGVRTACTPFLIYRGRTRHEVGLEGLAKKALSAARFHHAVWGPDELFYGELYSSRRVPCKPTLARPATKDAYSACVAEAIVPEDLYDFLLFSLPDNDYHSHLHGPELSTESIAHADACFGRLVEAVGGIDAYSDSHATIVMADHSQSPVERPLPIIEELSKAWRVQQPSSESPEQAELAVCPTSRAAAVYVLSEGRLGARIRDRVITFCSQLDGVDLVAHLDRSADRPWLVIARGNAELRFRPGSSQRDQRGCEWDLDGDREALELTELDGAILSRAYPDGLSRLWGALTAPSAGDVMISCSPGYECVDWGGQTHVGGGSHGALSAEDSLAPLIAAGVDGFDPGARLQWSLSDTAGLVLGHFAIEDLDPSGSPA